METSATSPDEPPTKVRLLLGGGVFFVGQLAPLGIPFVASSGWSNAVKSALSGILLLGIPELAIFLAIAILGKAGFGYLKQWLFSLLKRAAPADEVSPVRYRIGLVLFCLPMITGWLAPYVSDLIPLFGTNHVAIAIIGDGVLVLALFLLGGDFWDKVRALFVHRAKAVMPAATDTEVGS